MADGHGDFNFCRGCGAQVQRGKNFCTRCGTPVKRASLPGEKSITCPSCSHPNPEDSKFCVRCSAGVAQQVMIIEEDDLTVVKINAEKIDFENHKEIMPAFKKVLKKRIILDLDGVGWVDSTGIGALVTLSYKIGQSGQELKLVNVSQKVLESIMLLQVDNVMDICKSVNEARAAWGLPLV